MPSTTDRAIESQPENPLAAVHWIDTDGPRMAALSDGYIDLPLSVFVGVPEERMRVLLAGAGLAGASFVRTSVTVYLIEDEGRLILVDAGMGQVAGPTMGHLAESLALAGYQPADVTDVVMTHLHRDHSGGLFEGEGRATFPGARVHVPEVEYRYWTDPARVEEAPPAARPSFAVAQRAMAASEGRIDLLPPSARIGARVRTSPLPGHTVGHSAVWVEHPSRPPLCIWGDIAHCAALQVPAPELCVSFDTDPALAERTRRDMLRDAAERGFTLVGGHNPFPGLGRIVARGEGFALVPA